MLKGFREFISRGSVIDLAVGVVIGAAFTAVVTSVVNGILMPVISAIVGATDYSALTFQLGSATILYGSVLGALINFLLVAAALYFFVIVPMNALAARRKTVPVEEQAEPTELEVLLEIKTLLEKDKPLG